MIVSINGLNNINQQNSVQRNQNNANIGVVVQNSNLQQGIVTEPIPYYYI